MLENCYKPCRELDIFNEPIGKMFPQNAHKHWIMEGSARSSAMSADYGLVEPDFNSYI